jgi:hypothetical protein
MDARILELIEQEVDKRVQERLERVLEHISKTYGIGTSQLLRETATVTKPKRCMGQTAKKVQCMRSCMPNGYCKSHQNQKPVIVQPPGKNRDNASRRIPASTGMLIEL